MRRFALLSILLAAMIAPAAQAQDGLPTTSYDGARDGTVAPFEGNWSAMKPDGDPEALDDSCALPATIMANGSGIIRYASSMGTNFDFKLSAEGGATIWGGEPARIAVWQDEDSFLLYPRLADGTPETSGVYLYQRCPEWPRQSYAGAQAGALEPFVGRWQEAVPPLRGTGPLQIVGSCDDPTTYEISGPDSLRRIIAGEPDRTIPVRARGNETIVPNPIARYAPSIIVWVSPDRWHFHPIDVFGQTNWSTPVIYTRCP
jgi:hypothetical protein